MCAFLFIVCFFFKSSTCDEKMVSIVKRYIYINIYKCILSYCMVALSALGLENADTTRTSSGGERSGVETQVSRDKVAGLTKVTEVNRTFLSFAHKGHLEPDSL